MSDLPDDTLLSTLPDLLGSDPAIAAHLRARVLELIDASFDTFLDMIEEGDERSKAAIARQLLPMFMRVARDQAVDTTDEQEEMRETTRRLVQDMGANLGVADAPST